MRRCAVTSQFGRSRSSCANPSVKLFTAAFEALYAALPLGQRSERISPRNMDGAESNTYGGFVIPCFDPVLMTIAGFS